MDFNTYPQLQNYTAAAGWSPAAYNLYINLPLQDSDKGLLTYILPQIAALQAVAHITVEPWGGLKTVTQAAATDLANLLHTYELQGLTVILRFGQDMNGRSVQLQWTLLDSFTRTCT